MSTTTTPEPRDADRLPGDPANVAPNGGAPTAPEDAIAKRNADRAAHRAAERRASRY